MARVHYLGHAGFIVEHGGIRILVDPWFYPAFLSSWFPYPDNRNQLPAVTGGGFDYLYISHTHEDHFDRRTLEQLDRSVTVIVPKYRSKAMTRAFTELGFHDQIMLDHQERAELAADVSVTMLLDTSHKEDSGLLFDLSGFRFLDLNDCNTAMSELPGDVDLLAAQFSGAMWYPNCYDYDASTMQKKVDAVRSDLAETLVRKLEITGARAYLPSAGPACFLDPALEQFNDPATTIFPQWEDVADDYARTCPELAVLRLFPGDALELEDRPGPGPAAVPVIRRDPAPRPDSELAAYRERRRDEWSQFATLPDDAPSVEELTAYFSKLQRWNKRFLLDYTKDILIASESTAWGIQLGRLAEDFVIETEEPLDPDYTLSVEPRILRAILDGRTGWEEALLSMRVSLQRDPDVFDLTLMSLLRYGHQPAQTMQMVRERENTETIERDGLRVQRWCPHAGEDLTLATLENGVLECPRHHWKWDVATGTCIEGGTIPLRLEHLDPAERS